MRELNFVEKEKIQYTTERLENNTITLWQKLAI